MKKTSSQNYITYICELYNDIYDDRVENTCPPAVGNSPCIPSEDWVPGQHAEHKSLSVFHRQLQEMELFCLHKRSRKSLSQDAFGQQCAVKKPDPVVACIFADLKISKVGVSVKDLFSTSRKSGAAMQEGVRDTEQNRSEWEKQYEIISNNRSLLQ